MMSFKNFLNILKNTIQNLESSFFSKLLDL